MPSILIESGADLLIYGMGEKQVVEIADYLAGGADISTIHYVRGTSSIQFVMICRMLQNSMYHCRHTKAYFKTKNYWQMLINFRSDEQDPFYGKIVVQQSASRYVVQNQTTYPLTEEEMDYYL